MTTLKMITWLRCEREDGTRRAINSGEFVDHARHRYRTAPYAGDTGGDLPLRKKICDEVRVMGYRWFINTGNPQYSLGHRLKTYGKAFIPQET